MNGDKYNLGRPLTLEEEWEGVGSNSSDNWLGNDVPEFAGAKEGLVTEPTKTSNEPSVEDPNKSVSSDDGWGDVSVPEVKQETKQETRQEKWTRTREEIRSIFWEKYNSKEYNDFMQPFLNRLDCGYAEYFGNDIFSGERTFRKAAYENAFCHMAEYLEIEKDKRPAFVFARFTDEQRKKYHLGGSAMYSSGMNTVFVVDEDNGRGDEILDVTHEIAHEMWHKHQDTEIERGGPRAKIYQDNFDNYARFDDFDDESEGLFAYMTQPIEMEAEVFSVKYTEAVRKVLVEYVESEISKNKISMRESYEMDKYGKKITPDDAVVDEAMMPTYIDFMKKEVERGDEEQDMLLVLSAERSVNVAQAWPGYLKALKEWKNMYVPKKCEGDKLKATAE